MESFDESKAQIEDIHKKILKSKKNERANAPKEVKRLCKEFGSNGDI